MAYFIAKHKNIYFLKRLANDSGRLCFTKSGFAIAKITRIRRNLLIRQCSIQMTMLPLCLMVAVTLGDNQESLDNQHVTF